MAQFAAALVVVAAAGPLAAQNPDTSTIPRTHTATQETAGASGGTASGDAVPPLPAVPPGTPLVVSNDNRRTAGRLRAGVLTLHLEARIGAWEPEGPNGPAVATAVFAEQGRAPEDPGPLIRVRAGTRVRVVLSNRIPDRMLYVYGLDQERGIGIRPVVIARGQAHEFDFTATTPGTYYYAARTTPPPDGMDTLPPDRRAFRTLLRYTEGGQLNGGLVVDPADAPAVLRDRIFVISNWFQSNHASPTLADHMTMDINGLSWPATERFTFTVGDSVRWRWINATMQPHPLHLHGTYFDVVAKGDGARDTLYGPGERRRAVTEAVLPGQTAELVWSPQRPGNWVFHCHNAFHVSYNVRLSSLHGVPAANAPELHHQHDAVHGMAGLVLGITVKPKAGVGLKAAATGPERSLRLIVREAGGGPHGRARFGFALGGTPAESADAPVAWPGPTLVLQRGQPVAVTIVNRASVATTVHWHGLEVESYSDGMPGWSGMGTHLMPAVSPGDSLVVRFTPTRAGTFMYHSHVAEFDQLSSGLYGAIVVLEPGEQFDPEIDRVLLLSDSERPDFVNGRQLGTVLLNGLAPGEPIRLRAGTTYACGSRASGPRTLPRCRSPTVGGSSPGGPLPRTARLCRPPRPRTARPSSSCFRARPSTSSSGRRDRGPSPCA